MFIELLIIHYIKGDRVNNEPQRIELDKGIECGACHEDDAPACIVGNRGIHFFYIVE